MQLSEKSSRGVLLGVFVVFALSFDNLHSTNKYGKISKKTKQKGISHEENAKNNHSIDDPFHAAGSM